MISPQLLSSANQHQFQQHHQPHQQTNNDVISDDDDDDYSKEDDNNTNKSSPLPHPTTLISPSTSANAHFYPSSLPSMCPTSNRFFDFEPVGKLSLNANNSTLAQNFGGCKYDKLFGASSPLQPSSTSYTNNNNSNNNNSAHEIIPGNNNNNNNLMMPATYDYANTPYHTYTATQQYLYNHFVSPHSYTPFEPATNPLTPNDSLKSETKLSQQQQQSQTQPQINDNSENSYYPHYSINTPPLHPPTHFTPYDAYSKSFLAPGFNYQPPQTHGFIGTPTPAFNTQMFGQFAGRRDSSSHHHHPLSPSMYGQNIFAKNQSNAFNFSDRSSFPVGFSRSFPLPPPPPPTHAHYPLAHHNHHHHGLSQHHHHHHHHHEMEEINTRDLAQKISSELKRYSIPQAVFAQRVLCRSQGTLSDLLRNPKPWSKLKSGRETFRRMWKWLQEPEFQRMSALRLAACKVREHEVIQQNHHPSHHQQQQQHSHQMSHNNNNNNNTRPSSCSSSSHHASNNNNNSSNNANNNSNKKPRLVFTDIQRRTLLAIFRETRRPNKEMQATIADQLGLKVSTVANFFMNARRRSLDKYTDDDARQTFADVSAMERSVSVAGGGGGLKFAGGPEGCVGAGNMSGCVNGAFQLQHPGSGGGPPHLQQLHNHHHHQQQQQQQRQLSLNPQLPPHNNIPFHHLHARDLDF